MANETTPLKRSDERDPEVYEEYYEEQLWSKPTLYLLWSVGIILCAAFIYLFAIFLPAQFIPETVKLEGILKVKEVGSTLKVLSSDRIHELGLHHFQYIENDDKDENEDLELIVEPQQEGDLEEEEITRVNSSGGVERHILIGDIHGEFEHLKSLLKKISYNKKSDTVLLLGDFITKGPKSFEVLDWAIEHKAECILGNHEYEILQLYAQFHNVEQPFFVAGHSDTNKEDLSSYFPSSSDFNDNPDFLLAKKLQPRHVQYINSCPVMKTLGRVPFHKPEKNNGTEESVDGVAVHAGIRWDLTKDLLEQDPMDNIKMRKLLPPFYNVTTEDPHVDGAVAWTKVYRQKQELESMKNKLAVYYGHDARKGLRVQKYTKGLDSRCNAGGHLTAMVLWKEVQLIDGKSKVVYKEQPFQVAC